MPVAMPARSARPWLRSMPPCVARRRKHRLPKLRQPAQHPLLTQPLRPRLLLQACPLMKPHRLLSRARARLLPRVKPLLRPWPRPNPPSLLWRCGAMTAPAKRKQKPLQVATAAAMADPASAVRVPGLTEAPVAQVSVAVSALATAVVVAKAVMSARTAVRVWAMPLSVLSAKPWSAPKCRCANWPRKRTAKP